MSTFPSPIKNPMASRISVPSLNLSFSSSPLRARSKLVADLLRTSPNTVELPLDLPSWVSKALFQAYVAHVETERLQDPESTELARLAAYMQDERLEKTLVEDGTLGGFTLENIVARHVLAAENQDKSEVWRHYYQRTVQYAGGCLTQLLDKGLEQLSEKSLEVLLLEGLAAAFGRPNSDLGTVIDALKALWKVPTFAHLLHKIERKALESPPNSLSLAWNFPLGASSQFLSSPEFDISGLSCEIQVWYSSREDRLDCFLTSLPSQRSQIAAFTVSLAIWPDECCEDTSLVTLILGSKGHKLVRRVYGVAARVGSAGVTVQAKVRLEAIYSSLFDYFAGHFAESGVSKGAGRLQGERILQLLSTSSLSVASEDQVLRLVGQWAERHQGSADLTPQLGILLEQVKWQYVSTLALVDCSRLYPTLKQSPVFKVALMRQFEGRSGLKLMKKQTAREGYTVRKHREASTNLSTFLGELVAIVMTLDFTPTIVPPNQELKERLKSSLEAKERHVKDLRQSLSLIEQVFSMPVPLSPPLKPDSQQKLQAVLKSHSTTHSLTALQSGRPTIEEEVEDSNVDGKIVSLLHSLWSKVQEKAASPRHSAM